MTAPETFRSGLLFTFVISSILGTVFVLLAGEHLAGSNGVPLLLALVGLAGLISGAAKSLLLEVLRWRVSHI